MIDEKRTAQLRTVERSLLRYVREFGLSYDELQRVTQRVRDTADLQRPKRSGKLPRLITAAELERFFDAIRGDRGNPNRLKILLLFQVLYSTAARIHEVLAIRLSDVFVDERKIFLRKTKGGRPRYVPIDAQLADQLAIHMSYQKTFLFENEPGKSYTTRSAQFWCSDYCKSAGLIDSLTRKSLFSPHSFRHSRLTELAAVLSMPELQIVSGHAKLDSLQIYLHLRHEPIFEKIRKMEPAQHWQPGNILRMNPPTPADIAAAV